MALLLATGNEHKAKAIGLLLDRPIEHISIDLPEVQAIDVKEVIEYKARAAFQIAGRPVLVEDTSLAVHAWNGLPGALIRWFLETVGNEGICCMLSSYEQRSATAETCLGYFDGANCITFSGMVDGWIATSPRGDLGFGWDPIFIPNGWEKTFAEMTDDESATVSMRRSAVLKLRTYLDENGL